MGEFKFRIPKGETLPERRSNLNGQLSAYTRATGVHPTADEVNDLLRLFGLQPRPTEGPASTIEPLDLAHFKSSTAVTASAAKRARQINSYYSQLGEGLLEYVGPSIGIDRVDSSKTTNSNNPSALTTEVNSVKPQDAPPQTGVVRRGQGKNGSPPLRG